MLEKCLAIYGKPDLENKHNLKIRATEGIVSSLIWSMNAALKKSDLIVHS